MSIEIEKLTNLPASADLTADVRSILQEARKIVVRSTNTAMTAAYWLIGKRIVEEEQQFYKTYPDKKGQTLSAQLSWSHNCLIMRVSDPKAREWYLREAAREQWSVRQLERNINSFYYQRQLESGLVEDEKDTQCVPNSNSIDPRQFVKDPYVLEFVGLPAYPNNTVGLNLSILRTL